MKTSMKSSKYVTYQSIDGYDPFIATVRVRLNDQVAEGVASGNIPQMAYTKAMQIAGDRLRKVIAQSKQVDTPAVS